MRIDEHDQQADQRGAEDEAGMDLSIVDKEQMRDETQNRCLINQRGKQNHAYSYQTSGVMVGTFIERP